MTLSNNDIDYLEFSGEPWGSCYSYNKNGEPECSHALQNTCNDPSGFKLGVTCDTQSIPQLNKYKNFWNPDPIPAAVLSGISVGDPFLWGVYVGIYIPANISVSNDINVMSSTDTKQYAMIVHKTPFEFTYLKDNRKLDPKASTHNGKFNLLLRNSSDVPHNIDNTFKAWSFASIGELEFFKLQYAKYIKLREMRNILKLADFNISSTSVFNMGPSATSLQKLSPLNKNYLMGLNIEYGTLFLVSPYIQSNFLVTTLIEVI